MTTPITLTAAAAIAFAQTSSNPIIVNDTGSNIAANADALVNLGNQVVKLIDNNDYLSKGGFLSAINVADVLVLAPKMLSGFNAPMTFSNVVDTAHNVAANAAALLKLNAQVIGLTVVDTAQNIASQPAIFTLGNQLTGLVIDGTAFHGATTSKGVWAVNVSAAVAATLYADGMTGGVIQVTDTGANIAANADVLAKLGSQLVQVYDTSEYNTAGGYHANISVADVLALAPKMLDSLHNSMYFHHVVDSSQTIAANLDALQGLGLQVRGMSFTDATAPTLTITDSQYNKDLTVIKTINSKSYHLVITQAIEANISSDLTNSHVTSIGISDTAAHVGSGLATLQSHLGKISGITLTDAGTPTISATVAQVTADVGVLNSIQTPFLLSVKDTSAAINTLNLSAVHNTDIELMLTNLSTVSGKAPLTLTENTTIANLNLTLINLKGDTINEKAYNTTGTEIDILNSTGSVLNQLLFAHETEAQLHLIGVNPAVVHLI